MRIFVAGGTGVLGRPLVRVLIEAGHSVVATTHNPGRLPSLRAMGAEAVLMDGLDRDAVQRAVTAARPEVVVHQMTALGSFRSLKKMDQEFEQTNRLRTEGTRYLLDAARAAGARRFVAQSYTGWPNEKTGGRVKSEDDPLDAHPPEASRETLRAIRELESMVVHAEGLAGIVLRYGSFYGPGTSLGADGEFTRMVRKRRFPIVGTGAGVWSFIHVEDAARATQLAIEGTATGIVNVVDDEPAEVSEWLPALARSLGAKPPRHLPAWLGRLLVGEVGEAMMTKGRGSSNERARRTLHWQPRFASWRDGFATLA